VTDGRPRIRAPRRAGGDGVPDVFCVNEQSDVDIELERWRLLALDALTAEGVRGGAEINVFFIDVDAMTELNSDHMGKTGPTDVLAFPLDGNDVLEMQGPGAVSRGPSRPHIDMDDIPTMLGDVLLCPHVALQQAPTHAGTLDDEIALLLVHGILHVLGYDHDTDEATARMRSRERAILEEHHWRGPAPENFRQEHNE
jgi:probable rRNA maturation factor